MNLRGTMIYGNGEGLARVALMAVATYIALLMILRLSGKRTLSKLNAFDFVVTVALGSTLASAVTNRDLPLLEAILAIAMLVGLQFIATWLSVRSKMWRGWIMDEPTLLYRHQPLQQAMLRARVTLEELEAAAREAGLPHLHDAGLIWLETDGSLSVVARKTMPHDQKPHDQNPSPSDAQKQ